MAPSSANWWVCLECQWNEIEQDDTDCTTIRLCNGSTRLAGCDNFAKPTSVQSNLFACHSKHCLLCHFHLCCHLANSANKWSIRFYLMVMPHTKSCLMTKMPNPMSLRSIDHWPCWKTLNVVRYVVRLDLKRPIGRVGLAFVE